MARIILCIRLTSPAKTAVDALTERRGMTQLTTLSRLVEWFAKQSDVIQASALSHDPAVSQATTGLIIEKMLSGKKA